MTIGPARNKLLVPNLALNVCTPNVVLVAENEFGVPLPFVLTGRTSELLALLLLLSPNLSTVRVLTLKLMAFRAKLDLN